MPALVREVAEYSALGLELLAIAIVVVVLVGATLHAIVSALKGHSWEEESRRYRQRMARGILVGLEPLVAADIIHTVAIDLSFSTVGVLAIIVVIRTFLSFSLEVELTGRWPWQGHQRRGDIDETETPNPP